jgi:RNA polymerase sigma-70 factor, ECF subfamily
MHRDIEQQRAGLPSNGRVKSFESGYNQHVEIGIAMDYSLIDDDTLLRLMAYSQPEALSELYNRYSRLIYSLAIKMTGDAGTAEEVTQDVFLRAWENAKTYRPEQAKVRTWLARIARNRAIDMLRRSQARRENQLLSLDDQPFFALPDEHDVEQDIDLKRQQQRVRQALAQLPPDQLEPLALAYYRGFTHEKIAETLDQPLGTIKTRIRLAMRKLRQYLQEEVAA